VTWQKKRLRSIQLKKWPPEWRLAVEGGEFVPVGIEGMVTQFEGDAGSSNLPLKMKSTQPAGGRCGMTRLEVDVPIEEAARFD
jgi:hypothetical protein